MSDHTPSSGHDAHAAPTPSLMKKATMIAVLVGLPLVMVLSLVGYYKSHESGGGNAPMTEEAITARIQKVGYVSLGSSQREVKNGEDVYKAQCSTCHAAGLLGAPKFADAAAWGPRLKTGFDALLNAALKGKNSMTPQSGGAFSDYEIARAVVYMANAGGAKFDEPKAPADASTPAAAASAAK